MLQLYENIKKRRIELGISQQELAESVGYSGKSMISQVEKGMIDLPTTMIHKFADALQTTPSDLMGWEEDDGLTTVDLSELPNASIEELHQAFDLFKRFQNLSPEKQAALQVLLEVPRNDT